MNSNMEAPCKLTSSTGRRLVPLVTPMNNDGQRQQRSASSSRAGTSNSCAVRSDVGCSSDATRLSDLGQAMVAQALAQQMRCHDQYGFSITADEKAAEQRQLLGPAYVRAMEAVARPWQVALMTWEKTPFRVLKKLCRIGAPPERRSEVWQRLLGVWGIAEVPVRQQAYAQLCAQPVQPPQLADVIERDLSRTFPTHRLFEHCNGPGQQSLRRLLRSYANRNPVVGYCQGMGFVAATLLVQLQNEHEAFWAFCALMERPLYNMQDYFLPDFPGLKCGFYVFEHLLKLQSRRLYERLVRDSVEPTFYATHWFLTVFSYNISFSLLVRIWDMFLCEGWKPVYRVALAFLLMEKKKLKSAPNQIELILMLKKIQEEQASEQLIAKALSIKFKTAYMRRLVRDYYRIHGMSVRPCDTA